MDENRVTTSFLASGQMPAGLALRWTEVITPFRVCFRPVPAGFMATAPDVCSLSAFATAKVSAWALLLENMERDYIGFLVRETHGDLTGVESRAIYARMRRYFAPLPDLQPTIPLHTA